MIKNKAIWIDTKYQINDHQYKNLSRDTSVSNRYRMQLLEITVKSLHLERLLQRTVKNYAL